MPVLVVPELAAGAAALLAMGLLWGLYLLGSVMSGPFRGIPLVGGAIANGILSLMRAARDAAGHAFEAVLSAPTQLFKVLRTMFGLLHGEIANTISDVLGYAHRIELWLTTGVLPRIYSFLHYAVAWADHLYNVAVRYIDTQVTGALHWADHLYNEAVRYADTQVTKAAAEAKAYALALFNTAEVDITLGLQHAEALALQEATAAGHAAVSAVSSAATAGLAVPWQGIITDVDALRGIIADSWPDIRDAVDAIPRAVPSDLAGVISALGVLAIPMLRAMEDCVLPNCRNLSGLGQVINALRDGAEAAALVAWMAYCISDPVAAADDTEAVGGPVAAVTLGGLEALFGIRT